ncbi:MAG: hypothetical protein LBP54_07005 [Campylobacteraceae bacterium]|jgi:hypothetical protein|nr:hypothetical protein [Campylobacteraceae bacterium]
MKLSRILFFLFVVVTMAVLNTILYKYVPTIITGNTVRPLVQGFFNGIYLAAIFGLHEYLIKKELKQAK